MYSYLIGKKREFQSYVFDNVRTLHYNVEWKEN